MLETLEASSTDVRRLSLLRLLRLLLLLLLLARRRFFA